jgi:hypothetical protein
MILVFNVLVGEYLGFLFDFTSKDTLRIFTADIVSDCVGVRALEEP